ncbi:MAG: hypothetical protein RL329_549 [Bacteroidota bacterium]|jgi:hypothetical protein
MIRKNVILLKFNSFYNIIQKKFDMKLKHFTTVVWLFQFHALLAQSLAWYDNIGSRNDYFRHNNISVIQMQSDSHFVYVLGSFDRLPMHFQENSRTIPDENRSKDAFIAQYTHDGILKWVQTLGSYAVHLKPRRHRMALHKGNLYLTGTFFQQGWLGKDSIRTTQANVYLAKFDTSGNKIWHQLASPTFWSNDNEPQGIWVNSQEQIYIVGSQRGYRPLIFDSLATQTGSKQFVFKFDSAGKPLQVISSNKTQLLGSFGSTIIDAQIDIHDNFWLLMSDGTRNTYSSCAYMRWRTTLYCVTPQGQMDSIATIHCTDLMSSTALSIAENGDMYIAGQYRGQLEIGTFKSQDRGCSTQKAYLVRVTKKGQLVWFKEHNTSEFSDIYQLKTEKDGHLLVMGGQHYERHQSANRFRYPNYRAPYPNGEKRIFIKRMNPLGAIVDSVQFYTNDFEADLAGFMFFQMNQSPQGHLFLGIEYNCKLDSFSHSLCSEQRYAPSNAIEAYGSKVLIARLNPNLFQKKQLLPVSAENQFHVFPNPTTGFMLLQSNLQLQEPIIVTIYDMNGRLIQETTYPEKNIFMEIEIGNQPAGIYLLSIRQQGNLIFSKKIIKL